MMQQFSNTSSKFKDFLPSDIPMDIDTEMEYWKRNDVIKIL